MNFTVIREISIGCIDDVDRIALSIRRAIRRRTAMACCALILALATTSPTIAQTINVGSSADLNSAIQTIDNNPNNNYTLNLLNGFTMSQQVPDIISNATITLSGNSKTIDGANLYQPLVIDHGTVTLQNLNIANTAQPIAINGGTLIDTTGSLQGPVTNNGTVKFNEATSDTYAGNMSGTGHVEIGGAGAVTFSGTNAYSGGTTVDVGSTLIGTTTSLQGPILDNWLVQFNQTTNGTYAGNISGTGGVEISGSGSVTLTGSNSYSFGTLVDAGSSLVGTTTSLQGSIDNFGGVAFHQTTSGTYAGVISETGTVEISGPGAVTFTGLNTYAGGTIVDAGSTLIGTTSSLQGSFGVAGTLNINQSTTGTFFGNIAGAGSVEIGGGGRVTFTGTNSYTGGTTIDSNTSLFGTTDNIQGSITNSGLVEFNQATNGTYGGIISGSGSVEISGVGPIQFTGTNNYTGGTTIDIGSTLIGTTTSVQGAILDNGSLQFAHGSNGTFGGVISGWGHVEVSGDSLTLTGLNTYSGGTTVDSGSTLTGTTASVQGAIVNNGTVQFNNALGFIIPTPILFSPIFEPIVVPDIVVPGGPTLWTGNTYAGNMSGTGSVEIAGAGTLIFTGTNSYTGGTTVDAGNILIGNTNSLQGNFTDNGVVVFSNSPANGPLGVSLLANSLVNNGVFPTLTAPASIYAGNISGTGGVEVSSGEIVKFTGSNNYSGGTIVDGNGALIGTTTSLQGTFSNNGILVFDQAASGTYAGNISGAGFVQISGAGPVTFSGANSYSGGTSIDNGSTLIGTTHSLQGNFLDSGHLQFNQSASGTFAGVISGAGSVEIGGSGPITFSGLNTYTGGTSIDSGSTLIVGSTGSIAGTVNVNNGGTLMGEGSVASTVINAGGTIAPGTIGAPMTVNGNFTQNTGSTYTAEIGPSASDKIVVTGAAQINNGTVLNLVFDPGRYTVGSKYDILAAAGGLTGTYSFVQSSQISQNVVFTEQYNPNNLQLTVNSNLSGSAQSPNQAMVAAALDRTSGSATGAYANAITQLTTLNPGQLSGALNQLSGDIFPSLSTIQRQTTTAQMQLLSNRLATLAGPGISGISAAPQKNGIRFVSSQSSDTPSSASGQTWTSWAQGYGLGGNIAGDGNAGGTNYRLGGTLFGVERWLGENLLVGVLGGYANTSVNDRQDGSTASINAYQAGLYELFREDLLYVSNVDAFSNDSFNVTRPISFGTFQQTATGSSSGNQWAHYTEGGTTFSFDELRLQPFLGLQYMYLDQRGYSESGAGSLDMTTGHQIVNSVRNSLGARLLYETTWGNTLVVPSLSARYQHEWGNGTQLISSSFSGAPTAQFATSGNHTGRDFGLFTLGATAYVTERFSIYGNVDTQVAASFFALIGSGGIQYSW